jgi:mannose/cellobiose epimerase-like protein (N-acyl-D-glucosamine 2-epimerase family)
MGGMIGIDVPAIRTKGGEILKTLRTLITAHSLPLWSGEGWDSATGGFVEKLDIEGRADRAAPRRVRLQARQIYCFAKAADLGWYPQGREIAMKGLEYLLAKAKSPDGRPGYVHLLDPDGSTINAMRDTYDHAFVLPRCL